MSKKRETQGKVSNDSMLVLNLKRPTADEWDKSVTGGPEMAQVPCPSTTLPALSEVP